MPHDRRSQLIYEQSLIVEFTGQDAVTTLPELLKDPVDRYRALNFVFDIVGPTEQMDALTIAMFKQLQQTLLAMARDWHEPPAESAGAVVDKSLRMVPTG
jgi:hypothetical protein